jgi:uncharacterized protein (TIGR03435 family)
MALLAALMLPDSKAPAAVRKQGYRLVFLNRIKTGGDECHKVISLAQLDYIMYGSFAIVFVLLTANFAVGQAPEPTFEVASIKPHTGAVYSSERNSPGRFTVENVPLKYLISEAYEVRGTQIEGGPGWISTATFDVSAKAENNAAYSAMRPMLQTLLEERFRLVVHHDTKELTILALTSPKSSIKLLKSDRGTGGLRAILHGMTGTGVSMNDLVRGLSDLMGVVVIDQTGLTDKYDIHLEWSTVRPGSNAPGESIFDDVRQQLGLNLESRKAPVDVLVIDHAERPSKN